MSRSRLPWRAGLLSLVCSGLFSTLFLSTVDLPRFREAFSTLSPGALALFGLLTALMVLLRALRSHLLLTTLPAQRGLRRNLSASLVGFGAILLFPFRLGELVRPWLLASPKSAPKPCLRFSALLGISGVERVLDGLLISLLLLLILASLVRPPGVWLYPLLLLVFLLFLGGLLLLRFAVRHPKAAGRLVKRLLFVERLRHTCSLFQRLSERLDPLFTGLTQGLTPLKTPRVLVQFFGLSLAYWGSNALSLLVLSRAFGLPLSLTGALCVMGLVVVGIFIPSLPAHMGNYHHFALLGLSLTLPPSLLSGTGVAFVVTLHGAQLLVYTLMALVGVALGGLSRPQT